MKAQYYSQMIPSKWKQFFFSLAILIEGWENFVSHSLAVSSSFCLFLRCVSPAYKSEFIKENFEGSKRKFRLQRRCRRKELSTAPAPSGKFYEILLHFLESLHSRLQELKFYAEWLDEWPDTWQRGKLWSQSTFLLPCALPENYSLLFSRVFIATFHKIINFLRIFTPRCKIKNCLRNITCGNIIDRWMEEKLRIANKIFSFSCVFQRKYGIEGGKISFSFFNENFWGKLFFFLVEIFAWKIEKWGKFLYSLSLFRDQHFSLHPEF